MTITLIYFNDTILYYILKLIFDNVNQSVNELNYLNLSNRGICMIDILLQIYNDIINQLCLNIKHQLITWRIASI